MNNKNPLLFPRKTYLDRLLFHSYSITTPLGEMWAIADEQRLYLLEFIDCKTFTNHIERLQYTMHATIVQGTTSIHENVQDQIDRYFAGELHIFDLPLAPFGTPFQKAVWNALQTIPYGTTWSYALLARAVSKPAAVRAVARVNAFNKFAIIVPCHRVINLNGSLGGYNGGIKRKESLLEHEAYHKV